MPAFSEESVMSEGQSSPAGLVGCDSECHPCNQQVRYCMITSPPTTGRSRGDNIYNTGCLSTLPSGSVMLETTHSITIGGMVELNFTSEDGKVKYRAETVVCWVKMQDENTFHVGLEFQKVQQR